MTIKQITQKIGFNCRNFNAPCINKMHIDSQFLGVYKVCYINR